MTRIERNDELSIMNEEWYYYPYWSCRFSRMIQPGDVFGLTSMSEDRTTRLTIPPIYDQIAIKVNGAASAVSVRMVLQSEGCFASKVKYHECTSPYKTKYHLYHRRAQIPSSNVRIDIAFQIHKDNWYKYTKQ